MAGSLVLTACGGIFDFGTNPLVPESRWQVTAVDGVEPVGDAPGLAIATDGQSATLSGACGESYWELFYDTDGRALGFHADGDNASREDCTIAELDFTLAVEDGLRAVER